jgi:hypothetical protein
MTAWLMCRDAGAEWRLMVERPDAAFFRALADLATHVADLRHPDVASYLRLVGL